MKLKFAVLFLICLVSTGTVFSQVPDSLHKKFAAAKHDTVRIALLIDMASAVYISNPQEAIKYCVRSKDLSEKVNYKRGIAGALGWLGFLYGQEGKYDITMDYYKRSIPLLQDLGDEPSIAGTYLNMGSIYGDQGDIPKCIEYNHMALASYRKMGDKKGEAFVLNNLSGTYIDQGDKQKAGEYLEESLKIRLALKNKDGIAESYNNLGHFYDRSMDQPKKGLTYYQKSNELYKELNNKRGIAFSLHNIATVYAREGDTTKALETYYNCLEIKESINLIDGMPSTLNAIANILMAKHKDAEAERLLKKCLDLGEKMNSPEVISSAASSLRKLYKRQKNFEKALEMFELYKVMRDTIYNQSNRKETFRSQLKYDFDKKESALMIEQEKEKLEADAKHQKQQYVIWSVVGGLCIVGFFLIIIYNRLQITRKQKLIIEQQKELVETQQKEIVDSINYAKRIQYALLASKTLLENNLNEHFVFFKPKNVVSGDFYWATPSKDGFIFVLGDCTGHGVPGAFMSLLNISKLNQTINENKITSPDLVLNNVRKEIIQSLNPDGSLVESKDGMDAVVCKIDLSNLKLQYAAANSSFYIVRDNEVVICNADKMPVGMGHDNSKAFTLKEIALKKGDMIYMLSDGYTDQFGGPRGKKFMYKKLSELLVSICTKSINEQYSLVEKIITEWQGDLEQVDDICVVGIRV